MKDPRRLALQPANLCGEWNGWFHECGDDSCADLRVIMTVEQVDPPRFRGTLYWPDPRCLTRIEGFVWAGVLYWTELAVLRGSGVRPGVTFETSRTTPGEIRGQCYYPCRWTEVAVAGAFVLWRTAVKKNGPN
ncbi:MAG: hypothetical protein HYY13_01445 [Nitrospirae bacterium]|nr:hypothetical protein [Nitrospirota bacterium]